MMAWLAQFNDGTPRMVVFYGTYDMPSHCRWLIPDTPERMDEADAGELRFIERKTPPAAQDS